MKPKVYVETTIISYLTARPSRDLIVAEVRRVRAAHAAQFNNDLLAIYCDLKLEEQKSGRQFASYPARRVVPVKKAHVKAARLA